MTTDARTCKIEGFPAPGHTPGKLAKGHYLKTPTVFWERGNGTVPIATFHDIASMGDPEDNAELFTRAPDLAHALVGLVKAAKALSRVVTQHEDHVKAQDALYDALVTAEAALNG